MMDTIRQALLDYLDTDRPFSPLDAGVLEEDARKAFFDTQISLFSEYQEKPQVVVGRRGAGKTAFLESAHFTNHDDLIVPINKAQALGQIVLTVHGIPQGGRYPEAIADLWDSIVLTTVLKAAAQRFKELKIARDYLAKIGADPSASVDTVAWTLLNTIRDTQKGKTVSTIAELIGRLHRVSFDDAKQELFGALRQRGVTAIVLLDSLESEGYVFEDQDTVSALQGLLKWIGDTGSSRDPIQPRLSVPGEYHQNFLEISSNPLKDFARCSILRWRPRELISLAATRLRTYLELTKPQEAMKFQEVDLSVPKNALALLAESLPGSVLGPSGESENSMLYMLRHTQLIPRQLFLILNTVFASNRYRDQIEEADIRTGVQQAAHIVVSEIFGAYNHRHPKASRVSRRVLPNLPEVFSYGELHKAFNRHGRREYEELQDFVEMLLEIGAIGKVVETSSRYVMGQFQYNYDGPLIPSSNDRLCIHPAFRVMFPDSPRATVSRVWPVGVESKDS